MENVESKKSGFSITGLVLGMLSICVSFIPILNNASFILGMLALIFGIISLVKKASKGMAIAAIVLGVLSIIFTLSTINSVSQVLDETSEEIDNISGENTEEVLKNVDVNIGTFEVTTTEYGMNETKLTVRVTNNLDEQKSYNFEIEAVTDDGTRIDSDYVYASNLGAGQSQEFDIFTYVNSEDIEALQSASFQIVEASMY